MVCNNPMLNDCPLVMIEWDDSVQPAPSWTRLSDFENPIAMRCASVGWLIYDGDDVKVLAPNMADIMVPDNLQVSGAIRIPTKSVVKVTRVKEPSISSSYPSRRPSRPDLKRTRQVS